MRLKETVRRLIRTTGYDITRVASADAPCEKPRERLDVYNQDSLRTVHNHDFMKNPAFMAAYQRGVKADKDYEMHWRVHVALWTASHAGNLDGDFVECGVNRGFMSLAIMTYLDWNSRGAMVLLDDYAYVGFDEQKKAFDKFALDPGETQVQQNSICPQHFSESETE